jgi:hypothetical protein
MRRTASLVLMSVILFAREPAAAAAAETERAAEQTRSERVRVPEHLRPVPEIVRERPYELTFKARRPVALPVLYVTLGTLQAFDVYTTAKVLGGGGIERNPLIGPVTGNTAALAAVKAGATAATIFFAEKLWHRNKAAAIAAMVVTNGIMATVVANNVRNLQVR